MLLTDALALSHVPRWSIVPHSRPQNVADHTFRVMVIFIELASRLSIGYEMSDLFAVIYHDLNESRTGDIPTPAKTELGVQSDRELEFTHETIQKVFRLADLIEAFTYIERWGHGYHARRVAMELQRKVMEMADTDWPQVKEIIDAITFEICR